MLQKRDWPHAPVHRLDSAGIYMVTGATLHKRHFFRTNEHLTLLENTLLSLAKHYEWNLEAWAVFVNHYHFIGRAYPPALSLDLFVKHLHSDTARELNQLDASVGRTVWYNFWDNKLTYERSYFGSPKLRSSNPCEARTRNRRKPISLVLSSLV